MKIEILTRNIKNELMIREFIQRKVHTAMDRIESRIKQITIRLEDETKDSAAFDGLCRIEIEMQPRGHVHVSSTGDTVHDCIVQAIRKMEHAVKHDIDRHRRSSKIRHNNSKRQFIDSLSSDTEPVAETEITNPPDS